MESQPPSTAENYTSDTAPEPAEPCPTPLSTGEVFESFECEAQSWEITGPAGTIRGQTLGQGPLLYFLNGLESTSSLFRLTAWLLREEFRCVLFDSSLDPQSLSNLTGDASQLPDVQQLLAVADWHGEDDFTVYGSGFGGWVALAALLAVGERIRGAVLQAAYAERKFKLFEKLLLFLAKRSSRTLQDVPGWKTVFVQNHRRWFPPFDALRFAMFQEIAGNVPVQDIALRVQQLRKVRFQTRLQEISQPVLLLHSEGEGRLLQQRHQELQNALPHVRTEWLQNSGLVPHWTHPHRVAKLIRQFLADPDTVGQPTLSAVTSAK